MNVKDIRNLIDLKTFLLEFNIEEIIVDEFLKNKEIIKINNNTFLVKAENLPLPKNQVYTDNLLFIQLEKYLPSRFLLEFISNNSKSLQIKNEKQSLNYTYGKSLKLESLQKDIHNTRIEENRLYIVKFNEDILGYCKFNQSKKEICNIMNIGEYLKEN